THPVDPSDTMTFSLFGVTDFTVQSWNGTTWVTVATVNGNTLVKRTVTFAPVATASIRIVTTNALNGFSRLTEVEAWSTGPSGGGGGPVETNWALASNGGNVLVTSTPN